MQVPSASVKKAVAACDAAVYVLGRMAGEGGDRQLSEGDYYLSARELSVMEAVVEAAHALGKKAVLLLNMGGMADLENCPDFDAVLHVWMPGQEAGHSVADVVSGKVNPSGRLPFTWARNYEDYPSAADFPLSGGSDREVAYTEDIFVGYRHFDRSGLRVRYPFGYGLSYTDFAYEDLKVARSGNVFNASLTVSNTGTCAGREVVQLYVSSPEDVADRPLKELKSFAVTPVLMPGESCRVTMRFDRDDLSVWENGRWVVKRGKYRVYAASSAEDIRSETVVSAGL